MKYLKIIQLITFGLLVVLVLACAEENVKRGKKLFADPTLGESTNKMSCDTCHPNGEGLEKAGDNLEDVVNLCIERPLKGKPLPKDSQEMKDLVAYIRSLEKK